MAKDSKYCKVLDIQCLIGILELSSVKLYRVIQIEQIKKESLHFGITSIDPFLLTDNQLFKLSKAASIIVDVINEIQQTTEFKKLFCTE